MIDIVLPPPQTALEDWRAWQNNITSQFISHWGKKIYLETCVFCDAPNETICDRCANSADNAWEERL